MKDEIFNFNDLPLEYRYNYLLKQCLDLEKQNLDLKKRIKELEENINKFSESDEKLLVKIEKLRLKLITGEEDTSLAIDIRDKALHMITNFHGVKKITPKIIDGIANKFKEYCKYKGLY